MHCNEWYPEQLMGNNIDMYHKGGKWNTGYCMDVLIPVFSIYPIPVWCSGQCSDIMWVLQCLKSPATQTFVQQFKLRTKKTSKPFIIGPLWGESMSDWWIPLMRACHVDRISIPCHHHKGGVFHGMKCQTGPHLNIKTVFPRYGDFHVKDKTVAKPSCPVQPGVRDKRRVSEIDLSRTPGRANQAPGVWDRFIPA